MRIGVLADTHIPEAGQDLPPEAYEALAAVDLSFHCGDLHCLDVLDRLERIAPVRAARGNGDTYEPLGLRPGVPEDARVSEAQVVELEGLAIGLTHDLELAEDATETVADQYAKRVFGRQVDIAVCGHTHVPLARGLSTGLTFVNPGSPTLPYGYTHTIGTVAYLDLTASTFRFTVLDLATGRIDLDFDGPGRVGLVKGPRPKFP
jgi:putative phosphoesterase